MGHTAWIYIILTINYFWLLKVKEADNVQIKQNSGHDVNPAWTNAYIILEVPLFKLTFTVVVSTTDHRGGLLSTVTIHRKPCIYKILSNWVRGEKKAVTQLHDKNHYALLTFFLLFLPNASLYTISWCPHWKYWFLPWGIVVSWSRGLATVRH